MIMRFLHESKKRVDFNILGMGVVDVARSKIRVVIGAAVVVGGGILAGPALTQQKSEAPVARYTIDAGTMSGMAGMGSRGGLGSVMSMMSGSGGSVAHELQLRLGSSRSASGEPRADHFMPKVTGLGVSVPLVSPKPGSPPTGSPGETRQPEMPKARLLLYWGCGEHAGPGQPVVIDFAKIAKGQVPPNLYAAAVSVPEQWRVMQSNSTTFGEWPNAKDAKQVPGNSSLLGAHRIASNYAPEISFDLDTDYLAALQVQSTAMPSGAFAMNWNAIPGATGYYAWVMSAKTDRSGQATDMVWWASSAKQAFGGPMWEWLSPPAVAKLVADKTVMPSTQTQCTVPAEVKKSGGDFLMANMFAYGPQRDFAYPPRPKDPKLVWKPDWIARVRFRSNSMVMLGTDMPNMGASSSQPASDPAQPPKPKCKGLSGIAKRAAGLCE